MSDRSTVDYQSAMIGSRVPVDDDRTTICCRRRSNHGYRATISGPLSPIELNFDASATASRSGSVPISLKLVVFDPSFQ